MDLPSLWKCHFTGNTQYPVSYPICVYAVLTHIMLFSGVISMICLLWKEYKRNEAEEILVCLLAFATLGVSGMTALILYWVYSIYWYDMVFQAGIFCIHQSCSGICHKNIQGQSVQDGAAGL